MIGRRESFVDALKRARESLKKGRWKEITEEGKQRE